MTSTADAAAHASAPAAASANAGDVELAENESADVELTHVELTHVELAETVTDDGVGSAVGPGGAVIGRSRECDIVLQDSNVSRRHAEIRPSGGDSWTIADLGSTNGVKVNGRAITSATPLKAGDQIAIGTVDVGFEVER